MVTLVDAVGVGVVVVSAGRSGNLDLDLCIVVTTMNVCGTIADYQVVTVVDVVVVVATVVLYRPRRNYLETHPT